MLAEHRAGLTASLTDSIESFPSVDTDALYEEALDAYSPSDDEEEVPDQRRMRLGV